MEGLGINLGYFIVHLLNFIIMVVVLSALAYKPILKALENRRVKIAQGLEDARVAGEARANAEREASQIITDAQAKANHIIAEANERAEAVAREIRTEAEVQAAKERDAALGEVQQERERILGDLRGQVGALAVAVSQRLINQSLDEKRQHELINEFFSGVRSGKVVMLETTAMTGVSAEVTSALPLTTAEKDCVKSDILSKLGNQATVSFRVNPSILGGLVIKVGDKVMDASVAGQLESLRQSMY